MKLIEEQCRIMILKGCVEAKNILQEALLQIELLRPRMGNYAGKIDFLEVARYRNKKLKEKDDDNPSK